MMGLEIEIGGGLLAPLCGARDPQVGTPSTKSPVPPFGGPWSFWLDAPAMHVGGLLAPLCGARDPQMGTPSAKSPVPPFGGPWSFWLDAPAMHVGGLLAPLCGARDPQMGTPSTKSPVPPFGGPWSFCFPSSASQASVGLKAKIPFLRYAQEEDFVEVGGGFEPPYPVLQTDA